MLDGGVFFAPSNADFNNVHSTGVSNGKNINSINTTIGHFGSFDYQRQYVKNIDEIIESYNFIKSYTDSANVAVGIYMHGAGFSLNEMLFIGDLYARLKSSNYKENTQKNIG